MKQKLHQKFFLFLYSNILFILPFFYSLSSPLALEGKPIPFKLKQDSLVFKNPPEDLNQAVEILIFDKTNFIRKGKKINSLESNNLLIKIARLYSQDMLKRNYFSHYSPEGKTVVDRIKQFKPHYNESCSENLHFISSAEELRDPFAIVDQMIEDWLNSPPHRKNLLSKEYTLLGVGCATNGKRIYCAQVFSGPNL